MNVHSHPGGSVTDSATVTLPVDTAGARRERILVAAETCFIRHGFHRTTMQDLAGAAGMSAGNLYRYFPSKEALVVGLIDRARVQGGDAVVALEATGDRRAAILHVVRTFFVGLTPEKATLWLDIWAETVRNPALAASQRGRFDEGRAWFVAALSALGTGGDPEASFALLDPLMKGILVNRATIPGYDPEPAFRQLVALIDRPLPPAP